MNDLLLIVVILLKFVCSFCVSVYRIPSIQIPCYDDDNCSFGMLCSKNKTCICSRLYDWNEEMKQCLLNIQELGLWLSALKEEIDVREELDAKVNKVFFQVGLSGVFAIFLGLSGGLLCIYFFCFQKVFRPK